jgi:hypothetical protein
MPDQAEAAGLWISADGQLALRRSAGAVPIRVERGGRSVDAPEGQPVILRDQDLIRVNGRPLRLHVHGETEGVHAPERLSRSGLGQILRAATAAATLALGAVAAGAAPVGELPPLEVRSRPPEAPAMRTVDCTVVKQTVVAGKLQIEATCPTGHQVVKGASGYLIDAKSAPVQGGTITAQTVTGLKVTAAALTQTRAVPGVRARFYIPY